MVQPDSSSIPLKAGTTLDVWVVELIVGSYPWTERSAVPHRVGRAEVLEGGRLAIRFTSGEAGRSARALVEDDVLDIDVVTLTNGSTVVRLRP